MSAEGLLLVAPMVPRPGETPGEWWEVTGHADAVRALDLAEGRDPETADDPLVRFLHDVPPELASQALAQARDQSSTPFMEAWPLASWPATPTRAVIGEHDRFFPAPWLRALLQERLGLVADQLPCGHVPPLAQPERLADWLRGSRT